MLLLLTIACHAPEEEPQPDPVPKGPPTDTFPSFYGSVPKNLLMVSIDTLRKDKFTRFGSPEVHMRFLERKAELGVSLEDHRSCADWTLPSILCVIHGSSNIELGMVPDLHYPDDDVAPDGNPLALRLSDAGWKTILVSSNGWFSAEHNADVGYQVAETPGDHSTDGVFSTGLPYIEEAAAGDAPWYAQLHVKEPHPPYDPPDSYLDAEADLDPITWDLSNSDDQYAADEVWPDMTEEEQQLLLAHLLVRYDGELAWLDDQLAAQFAILDDEGLLNDTLVVFWNDHGEQFWEHGDQTHAYGLNREENDGWVFFWAKNIVPGTWDEPTSHPDIVPTLLSLYGLPLTDDLTGMPVGTAPPDRALDGVAVARLGVVQSMVQDGWKLIYRWSTGEYQLYDTVSDPQELTDLYTDDEPHAVALKALLAPRVEALQPLAPFYTPH